MRRIAVASLRFARLGGYIGIVALLHPSVRQPQTRLARPQTDVSDKVEGRKGEDERRAAPLLLCRRAVPQTRGVRWGCRSSWGAFGVFLALVDVNGNDGDDGRPQRSPTRGTG